MKQNQRLNRHPKPQALPTPASTLASMTLDERLRTSMWGLTVAREAFEHDGSGEREYYAVEIAALEMYIETLRRQGAKSPRQLEKKRAA